VRGGTFLPAPCPRQFSGGGSRLRCVVGFAVVLLLGPTVPRDGEAPTPSPTEDPFVCRACHAIAHPSVRDMVSYAARRPTLETPTQERRPFLHANHEGLPCVGCHSGGGSHGVPRAWTAADCAACHHREDQPVPCVGCHESIVRGDTLVVSVAMTLTAGELATVRDLSFAHGSHEEFACGDCHARESLRIPRTCASCHAEHVAAEVECTGCHVEPGEGVHDVGAHVTCSGAGCHSQIAAQIPTVSRAGCLVCHRAQRDHEEGRTCVACHALPAREVRASGGHVGVSAFGEARPNRGA
jgi:hypothetical protein